MGGRSLVHCTSGGSQLLWLFGRVPYFLPYLQQIFWEAFRQWGLKRSRQAGNLLQQKAQARRVEFVGTGGLRVIGSESTGLLSVPRCCGCLGRFLSYCPECSNTPGRPSDCGIFRGTDKLMICPSRRHRQKGSHILTSYSENIFTLFLFTTQVVMQVT